MFENICMLSLPTMLENDNLCSLTSSSFIDSIQMITSNTEYETAF
jgi:hypothetical protein